MEIRAEDHKIPATICIPNSKGLHPAVVMLHGTGSHRNEAGNGYQTAAREFAEKYGIASIRIDFMGNGDSAAKSEEYNFTNAVGDTLAAIEYIKTLDSIDGSKAGIMGWSQGGTIAMLTASRYGDRFKSIVTWAGAVSLSGLFNEEDYKEAVKSGYFVREYDWRRPLHFGLQWCKDVRETDILNEFAQYKGPVLAIAGTEDDVIEPEYAGKIISVSQNKNSAAYFIEKMNHTFNIFSEVDHASFYKAVEQTGKFFRQTLGDEQVASQSGF